ncbi:MAG TPA: patatin-like phospholipase family protein [Mycobacteriales bacterium]|nr:patatin-like phospholipase family protein [Mycobacteriales bacterium]
MGATGEGVTRRGLVLGGGGVAGIAWELGILTGLADAGVDVTNADRFVGTSAGSAVAAQVTSGRPLTELFDLQVSADGTSHEITVDFDPEKMAAELMPLVSGLRPGREMRRVIGGYALSAQTVSEATRRQVIEARLPTHAWPDADADVRIVAVDAETGETRVFTGDDDVSLVDAVAASCSVPGVWPPVTIGGRRYTDGGMRSGANVDLALGCDVVVVVQPMDEWPRLAPEVQAGLDELMRTAKLLRIRPDDASLAAMGSNALDPASARPSALAGRAQAAAVAADVRALWAG